MVRDVGPATRAPDQRRERLALLVGVLDAQRSTGHQEPGGGPEEPPDDVEAVGPAPESERRVVVGDLLRHPRAVGHVRRVGDDDVDAAVEVTEQSGIPHVAGEHLDRGVPRGRAGGGVVPGPLDGVGVVLDGGHPRSRVLVRDRQGEGARPRAEVDDHRLGDPGDLFEHPAGQQLGFGPGVFVPRPETEQLTGWALERLAGTDVPVVVDLGSGSGAIALSIAHEYPGARVTAVERDAGAIEWTRHNAVARAEAGDTPVTVIDGDMTDPGLLRDLDGAVDLVVSNPPYVPDGARVPREVADHDPPLALWGGPDGLDVVRGLLVTAARLLRPGGWLGIEHADQQGSALPALVRAHGAFTEVEDHPDLAGRPRFTTARRG